MATRKLTLKTIKDMVKSGAAQDIDKMKNPPSGRNFRELGYSLGVNGVNGALFLDTKTGRLYAICGRTSSLFEYL
jgi:hypothetical protein